MIKKDIFLSDVKDGEEMKTYLMIMKIIFRDAKKVVCILADKSGDIKGTVHIKKNDLSEGMVLLIEGKKDNNLEIKKYEIVTEFEVKDFLPTVKRPIEEIMEEIELYTEEYITSREGKELNDYFFKNEEFLERFKNGIGGVSMHHNYIGGLAEHTLGVMHLTSVLCERYDCRNTEIAMLAAKLHDIGKIYELSYDGPFKYTLQGEMEGHIVIGVNMLEKAFAQKENFYTEEFMMRVKGCIVQHHGKMEYGSPRELKMEEAFIVNFADNIDATMAKIVTLKEKTEGGTWSEYDRKLETKLFL